MDQSELERRLIALETALAHNEAEIRDLSDVIARQWHAIDGLSRRLDRAETLIGRLHAASSGGEDPTAPE